MEIKVRSKTSSVIWSGIIAGLAFMMLEMMMVPAFLGDSAWAPPRMIAAIIMGRDVLPPPATFNFGILMAAMVVHFPLSIFYTFVLSLFISNRSTAAAITIGGIFGLALYLVNFYGFTAIFPWFEMARNWVSIFAHIMFGIIAGYSFSRLSGSREENLIAKRKKKEPVDA